MHNEHWDQGRPGQAGRRGTGRAEARAPLDLMAQGEDTWFLLCRVCAEMTNTGSRTQPRGPSSPAKACKALARL